MDKSELEVIYSSTMLGDQSPEDSPQVEEAAVDNPNVEEAAVDNPNVEEDSDEEYEGPKTPVDNEEEGSDDEEESEEEEEHDSSDDSGESTASIDIFAHSDHSETGSSDSDESLLDLDLDDFSDCNLNDTAVKLHQMIDTCHDLEETQGFRSDEDKMLRKQVKRSAKLLEAQFMPESNILEINKTMFRRPMTPLTQSGQESEEEEEVENDDDDTTPDRSDPRNGDDKGARGKKRSKGDVEDVAPSDEQKSSADAMKSSVMYLAYKHTNMCAHLMQKRTDSIGLEEPCISVDAYVTALGAMAQAAAPEDICKLTSRIWNTAPSVTTVVGAFDHKEFLAREHEVVEKPAKKEVKRRNKQFDPDTLIATQTEVKLSKEDSAAKSKESEESAKTFKRSLKNMVAKTGTESVNIHEFTLNKESVSVTVNNMFDVAFGVREGVIALTAQDNQIKIAPVKAPKDERKKKKEKSSNRGQCIVSISAAQIRRLQEIAKGETVVAPQAQTEPIPNHG